MRSSLVIYDGYTENGDDCDDTDPDVYPGADDSLEMKLIKTVTVLMLLICPSIAHIQHRRS